MLTVFGFRHWTIEPTHSGRSVFLPLHYHPAKGRPTKKAPREKSPRQRSRQAVPPMSLSFCSAEFRSISTTMAAFYYPGGFDTIPNEINAHSERLWDVRH
ncbi:MAG TPA: hypothetical protein VHX14_07455 [Thermoanaerobaculia bacterium]|jgi:hypothetical protein|nr:hypothetical protein [Thermoanaerobaculia bacterium]